MKTMDIQIKMTPYIIKDRNAFGGESVADKSKKAENEFNVHEYRADITIVKDRSDIFS